MPNLVWSSIVGAQLLLRVQEKFQTTNNTLEKKLHDNGSCKGTCRNFKGGEISQNAEELLVSGSRHQDVCLTRTYIGASEPILTFWLIKVALARELCRSKPPNLISAVLNRPNRQEALLQVLSRYVGTVASPVTRTPFHNRRFEMTGQTISWGINQTTLSTKTESKSLSYRTFKK